MTTGEPFTREQFDWKLEELLDDMSGGELLAIPGLYDVVSVVLNNNVLAALKEEQEEESSEPDEGEDEVC